MRTISHFQGYRISFSILELNSSLPKTNCIEVWYKLAKSYITVNFSPSTANLCPCCLFFHLPNHLTHFQSNPVFMNLEAGLETRWEDATSMLAQDNGRLTQLRTKWSHDGEMSGKNAAETLFVLHLANMFLCNEELTTTTTTITKRRTPAVSCFCFPLSCLARCSSWGRILPVPAEGSPFNDLIHLQAHLWAGEWRLPPLVTSFI